MNELKTTPIKVYQNRTESVSKPNTLKKDKKYKTLTVNNLCFWHYLVYVGCRQKHSDGRTNREKEVFKRKNSHDRRGCSSVDLYHLCDHEHHRRSKVDRKQRAFGN